MSWKPIDFQGIVTLDTHVVDMLEQYLHQREDQLAHSIVNEIPPPSEGLPAPFSANPPGSRFKLDDAIDYFSKRPYHRVSRKDWTKAVTAINNTLWDYVSVLEGC